MLNTFNPDEKIIYIEDFNPNKHKISDYVFIILLNGRTRIIDKITRQELKDLDGKCILVKFSDDDPRQAKDVGFKHENYFLKLSERYRIESDMSGKKLDSDTFISDFEENNDGYYTVDSEFAKRATMEGITTLYNLTMHNDYGEVTTDEPSGLVYLASNVTSKNQYNTLKSVLNSMQKERFELIELTSYHSIIDSVYPESFKQLLKPTKNGEYVECYKQNLLSMLIEKINSINVNLLPQTTNSNNNRDYIEDYSDR